MVRAETQTTPTQSKQYLFKRLGVLRNRRLPIGQKFLPLRTLRLCGEVLKESFFSPNLVYLASWRKVSLLRVAHCKEEVQL